MALITKEPGLRLLDEMLARGTYKIRRVSKSNLGTDFYTLQAPGACQDTIFVPVYLRPDWLKKYWKG